MSDFKVDFDMDIGGIAFAYSETDADTGEVTTKSFSLSYLPFVNTESEAEANQDGA
ncbi:hypothetical protein ACFLWZ_08005 [Chloroflexota bacterium]